MSYELALEDGKVFYLNYTVSTTFSEKHGGEEYQTTVKIYANKYKSYFISKEVEVYQDKSYKISILPAKKIIFLAGYPGDEIKETKMKSLSFMQDTLLSLSTVEYCRNVTLKNGEKYKKVKLKINDSGKKLFKASTLEFLIDEKNNQIKQVLLKYVQKHHIAQLKIVFNVVDYDHKSTKLDKKPLAQVFNADGELLVKYKNYKVIDNRNMR